MSTDLFDRIKRNERETHPTLFDDLEPDWRDYWWGLPEFSMGDVSPERSITVHFATVADARDFAQRLGLRIGKRTDSVWFPQGEQLKGDIVYDGEKRQPRYPIFIPSKGRWENQNTGRVLEEMGTEFFFVVEETEYDSYVSVLGAQRVLKLPFHDLGQGSIPARNWIWNQAKETGARRHWVIDDNIGCVARMHNNRRLNVKTAAPLCAIEDFTDRYTNIAFAGPHDKGFCPDRKPVDPILFNSRVYSCTLIDTALPHRWRGRYNEDTDICLRALKDGYCTALFRAFLIDKGETMKMKGGNTDTVYATGDHRREFAESLQRQHPDCVKVVWKFNRWHHQVDYSSFAKNRPVLRADVTPIDASDNFGMALVRKGAG